MGVNLHIFNPEHDYALAVGEGPYTPPGAVLEMTQKMALLPAVFAKKEDFILVPDKFDFYSAPDDVYKKISVEKKLSVIKESDVSGIIREIGFIRPWGWNHHLKRRLSVLGFKEVLPSDSKLEDIRKLSHRRTSIKFREYLSAIGEFDKKMIGKELFSQDEVKEFLSRYPYSYFKTPWSSSGRGVVSSTHISEKGLLEWVWGSIRRQGSVIAEPGWRRKIDFASEWYSKGGAVEFSGISVFKTSGRGKYLGNLNLNQKKLWQYLKEMIPRFDIDLIHAQWKVLNDMIGKSYEGPVGIDMLSDEEGNINSCVEINLRATMGHVALAMEESERSFE